MSISVPPGLRPLLEEFTIAVMRAKPEDIVEFAATYFTQLYSSRGGQQGDAEMASTHSGEVHMGKTLSLTTIHLLVSTLTHPGTTHRAQKRQYLGWCVCAWLGLSLVDSGSCLFKLMTGCQRDAQ